MHLSSYLRKFLKLNSSFSNFTVVAILLYQTFQSKHLQSKNKQEINNKRNLIEFTADAICFRLKHFKNST